MTLKCFPLYWPFAKVIMHQKFRHFLCCHAQLAQAAEQTVDMPVTWDTLTFMCVCIMIIYICVCTMFYKMYVKMKMTENWLWYLQWHVCFKAYQSQCNIIDIFKWPIYHRHSSLAELVYAKLHASYPADTRRNNNVIIKSKRRRDVVLT